MEARIPWSVVELELVSLGMLSLSIVDVVSDAPWMRRVVSVGHEGGENGGKAVGEGGGVGGGSQ